MCLHNYNIIKYDSKHLYLYILSITTIRFTIYCIVNIGEFYMYNLLKVFMRWLMGLIGLSI